MSSIPEFPADEAQPVETPVPVTPVPTTRAAAAGPKPDIYVVEDNFHARLSSGELVLRTKIPYKTFKRLTGSSNGNSLDDLELFVTEVGDENSEKVMNDCDDTIYLLAVAMRYFELINEKAEALLGEFKRSSNS